MKKKQLKKIMQSSVFYTGYIGVNLWNGNNFNKIRMKTIYCPCALQAGVDIEIPPVKLRYKYMSRTFFVGRHIRWLIENDRGERILCGWCGNIANGIITGEFLKTKYQVPVCKGHIETQLL